MGKRQLPAEIKPEITEDDRLIATRFAIKRAQEDLLAFVMLIDPAFCVGPHHRLLCDELMKVERGDIDRLMVFVAPRSSKSLLSSIYFPAWALGRHGTWQLLTVSHSSDLSSKFGRDVRDVITSTAYQAIFNTTIRKDNRAADQWGTNQGGLFTAAGAGSGIAGRGAHLGIIDDPISEQDAWSKANRTKVNEWYPGGFRTRLMPGGKLVIVQTRWHEDDLSGYLLRQMLDNPFADEWTIVKIPAFNTPSSLPALKKATNILKEQGYLPKEHPDPLIDESFWPAPVEEGDYNWNTKELKRTKANMPDYQWEALYMQNPVSPEGGILKDKYWVDWDEDKPPSCDYILMSMDTAFSTKTSADFSAITVWGIFKPEEYNIGQEIAPAMILLGADKGRWAYPELRQKAIDKWYMHEPDGVFIEKKASGQSLLQDLRMAGVPVLEYQPDRDKEARAHAITSLLHNNRIYAPRRKPWAQDVIDECRVFPNGTYDDYVDTVTQAVLWLRNGSFVMPTDTSWQQLSENDILNNRQTQRSYY